MIQVNDLLVCLGTNYVVCQTFGEAAKIVTSFIDTANLGSRDFYSIENIGVILHPTKGPFAHVSYNGRVWVGIENGITNKEEIIDLNTSDYHDTRRQNNIGGVFKSLP